MNRTNIIGLLFCLVAVIALVLCMMRKPKQ